MKGDQIEREMQFLNVIVERFYLFLGTCFAEMHCISLATLCISALTNGMTSSVVFHVDRQLQKL